MKFLSFSISDTGKKRKNNEDAFIERPDIGLFVVADGMGGERFGEVASALSVECIEKYVRENSTVINAFKYNQSKENRHQVLNMLADALRNSNTKVYREAEDRNVDGKMGTTLTALLTVGSTGFMVHVGDSRLYMIRGEEITQLSTDHTVANEYRMKYGESSEGFDPGFSSMLTRAIGIKKYVEPEKLTFTIVPDDRYLLCSDGLHNYFEKNQKEVDELLTDRTHKPEKEDKYISGSVNSFLEIAYKGGADDNVTVIMLSAFGVTDEEVTGTRTLLDEFAALRDIELFKNLDYKELLTVMENAEIRTYNRFDVVSRTNSSSKELFVIVEGKVSALKGSKHIKTFVAGNHIGEVAFLTGEQPAFNLFVDKTSTFLVLKREVFDKIVSDNPALGIKLLWQLATALAMQTNSSIGLIK